MARRSERRAARAARAIKQARARLDKKAKSLLARLTRQKTAAQAERRKQARELAIHFPKEERAERAKTAKASFLRGVRKWEELRKLARLDRRNNWRRLVKSRKTGRLVMAARKMTVRELSNARRTATMRAYWREVKAIEERFNFSLTDARSAVRLSRNPATAAAFAKLGMFAEYPERFVA